jgi:diguanylate cyclase (GGDEF)-like protein
LIGTLQDLATKDFLTGLSNRRHFFDLATKRLDSMKGARKPYAIGTLDIDHFKKINDTYGHDGGDLALKAVSKAISEHGREGDIVARFGGEEFVVFASGLSADEAMAYFEALRERIEKLDIHLSEGRVIHATTSIGVCTSIDPSKNIHALLGESDRMLYTAKVGGRNRVEHVVAA